MAYTPVIQSKVSTDNSTTTTIANGNQFTGPWEEVFEYFGDITVSYNLSSPGNALCTINLEFSQDTNSVIKNYTQPVSTWLANGYVVSVKPVAKYFRLRFQNQSGGAVTPKIQTLFGNSPKGSKSSLTDAPSFNDDIINTKSSLVMIENGGKVSNPSSKIGSLNVNIDGPLSGFGELLSAEPTPINQLDFIYGINPLVFETETYGQNAQILSENNEARLRSGTVANTFAMVNSKRPIHYRQGQGTEGRFTARFVNNAVGTRSMAGLGNPECGYYFGYDETSFGIFYITGGKQEIQSLHITSGAGQNDNNVTITLDGVQSAPIAVTSGTAEKNASEIAKGTFSTLGRGWEAYAVGPRVFFIAKSAYPATGNFSLTQSTAGMTFTFTEILSGASSTKTFTSKAQWNIDPMDGSGYSGMILDPTKGNVYSIVFQYLGYGNIFFSIEESKTGRLFPVHTIRYANSNTAINISNPSVHLNWQVENLAGTTNLDLRAASCGGFVHGKVMKSQLSFSVNQVKTNIGTNVEVPIFSLRAGKLFNGRVGHGQILLESISAAMTTGNKPTTISIYKASPFTSSTNFAAYRLNVSIVDIDVSAATITPGLLLYSFVLPVGGSFTTALRDLDINIETGEYITITANTANAADIFTSLTWSELQ
jgi:hypothetical protein